MPHLAPTTNPLLLKPGEIRLGCNLVDCMMVPISQPGFHMLGQVSLAWVGWMRLGLLRFRLA
jgi:hypothetical protein